MPKPFMDISLLGDPIPTRDKNELRFCCPYCEDEQYHCYVNTAKGVYHCFRCGTSGRTNARSGDLESLHLIRSRELGTLSKTLPTRLPSAHSELLTPTALKYLVKRGIKESDVERWKIYCAAPHSKYFGRLIIPYNAVRGYCSYFVARAYTSLPWPKYLNPPGRKDILFFSPQLPSDVHPQLWNLDELVLVEGPFDVIKAGRYGPAAAILGKDLKHSQARIIVASFTKVFVLLDNEGTKTKINSFKIKDLLSPYVDVEILECPAKDPGEMEDEDFRELFGG